MVPAAHAQTEVHQQLDLIIVFIVTRELTHEVEIVLALLALQVITLNRT